MRGRAASAAAALLAIAAASCPCADVSLCAPLDIPPRPEVFGFSVDAAGWQHYPLDVVTTIVNFAGALPADTICRAHAARVRVLAPAPFPAAALHNASYVAAFTSALVATVTAGFFDGVNFDFEDPLNSTNGDAAALTAVVAGAAAALRAASPALLTTVDVAWSPACIDLRCYDYVGLAAAADIVYVMAYDMRSQVFWPAPCDASANSPLPLTMSGMAAWADLGVPPAKLVLGVPWYGYRYRCIDGAAPDAAYCPIERVTWRGVNCSDAVGSELNYADIRQLLANNATRPRVYNDSLAAPFFNIVDAATGQTEQLWYDDPASLSVKVAVAKAAGWRGVGPWNFDALDSTSTDPDIRRETREMWDVLAAFRQQ